jgi:hypothetical protein
MTAAFRCIGGIEQRELEKRLTRHIEKQVLLFADEASTPDEWVMLVRAHVLEVPVTPIDWP